MRDLVGSTNRERRGDAEANTTYAEPSAISVHNENSDDIRSIFAYSLALVCWYAIYVQRYPLLPNVCNKYARESCQHIYS